MRDDAVRTAIDRIVAGADAPTRAERDDLRRELETHFEEACAALDSLPAALRRFGSETEVTGALRRVYRRDARLVAAARVAASLVASIGAAIAIETLANLRVASQAWRLAPAFAYAAPMGAAVALAFVALREARRAAFTPPRALAAALVCAAACAGAQLVVADGAVTLAAAGVLAALGLALPRAARGPIAWMLTFAAFATVEYALHLAGGVAFGAVRAATAAAVLVAVCAATRFIGGRVDRVFVRVLDTV